MGQKDLENFHICWMAFFLLVPCMNMYGLRTGSVHSVCMQESTPLIWWFMPCMQVCVFRNMLRLPYILTGVLHPSDVHCSVSGLNCTHVDT